MGALSTLYDTSNVRMNPYSIGHHFHEFSCILFNTLDQQRVSGDPKAFQELEVKLRAILSAVEGFKEEGGLGVLEHRIKGFCKYGEIKILVLRYAPLMSISP